MRYDHKKLKDAKDAQLLTSRELARKAGISESALSKILRGGTPWIKAIRSVAKVLGVDDVVITSATTKKRGERSVA